MVTPVELRLLVVVVCISAVGANGVAAAPDSKTLGPVRAVDLATAKTSDKLINIREYKQTMFINLEVGQARLIKLANRVTRTSTSDPSISSPVVVSESQILLLGKTAGRATLTLWDDAGNVVRIGLCVQGQGGPLARFERALSGPAYHMLSGDPPETHLQPEMVGAVNFQEISTVPVETERIDATPKQETLSQGKPLSPPWVLEVPEADNYSVLKLKRVVGTMGRCKIGTSADIEVSQARSFRVDRALVGWSESDPTISEPVIVSDHEIVLLGKKPGRAVIGLTDEDGNRIGIETRVRDHQGGLKSILRHLAERVEHHILNRKTDAIPPVVVKPVNFGEIKSSQDIDLKESQATLFETKSDLVRIFSSNPTVAEVLPSDNGFYIWSKSPGNATAFVWDEQGNVEGLNLHVTGNGIPVNKSAATPQASKSGAINPLPKLAAHSGIKDPVRQVECWTSDVKSVWDFSAESVSAGQSLSEEQTYARMLRAISFNNQGVKALNEKNYELAISKFIESLKIDRAYRLARDNLDIAYNNYGLLLRDQPRRAITQFHFAIYIDPNNQTALQNLRGIIRTMGKDPDDFDDRVALAEQATADGDIIGAVMEYQAALHIKDDPRQQLKLDAACKKLRAAEDKQSPYQYLHASQSSSATVDVLP